MKTINKLIYSAVAVDILGIRAINANSALNDLFVCISGDGTNGGGFTYEYTPTGLQTIFASGLSFPRGVAFGPSGNLFVANTTFDGNGLGHGSIVKITPGGVQSLFAAVPGDKIFAQDVPPVQARNPLLLALSG